MLFRLRLKKPGGVVEEFGEAPDLEHAEHAARAYVGEGPGYQFISVKPFITWSWQATDPVEPAKPNGKARIGA